MVWYCKLSMLSIRTKDPDKFSKKLLLVVEKTVRIFNQITMLMAESGKVGSNGTGKRDDGVAHYV